MHGLSRFGGMELGMHLDSIQRNGRWIIVHLYCLKPTRGGLGSIVTASLLDMWHGVVCQFCWYADLACGSDV